MTRSKYFFYPEDSNSKQDPNRNKERALPAEQSEELAPPSFAFRAGSTRLHRPMQASAERTADTVLSDLGTLQSRMASKKTAVPLSSLLSLLLNFCGEYPTITAHRIAHRDICIGTCTHNLLFAIGTIVHYAAANSLPLEIVGGEDKDGPMILLRAEQSSLTPEEAAGHFGLSPYRLAVLERIAAASDFSFVITPADRSELCFRIPIYTHDTFRVFALTDPTLRAAFMQPLSTFVF